MEHILLYPYGIGIKTSPPQPHLYIVKRHLGCVLTTYKFSIQLRTGCNYLSIIKRQWLGLGVAKESNLLTRDELSMRLRLTQWAASQGPGPGFLDLT